MTDQTPRIFVHPTLGGLWLTPDTPAGRELIQRVPPRPAIVRMDANRKPGMKVPLQVALLPLGAAGLIVVLGGVLGRWGWLPALATYSLAVAGLFIWMGRRAEGAWAKMRTSGLAVPVPTEWLNDTQLGRLNRRGKVSRAELASLPRIEGVPALVWAWKAGRQHEAVAMERLPN